MRLGGELDGAEQAVQSPEILVFQPRGARVFVAGDGERMLGFGGIGGVAIAVSQRSVTSNSLGVNPSSP